jgi:hypothetical protein
MMHFFRTANHVPGRPAERALHRVGVFDAYVIREREVLHGSTRSRNQLNKCRFRERLNWIF